MRKLRLVACLILTMGTLRLDAGSVGAEAPADLLSFQRRGETLLFDVISTGCTRESDFRLDVSYIDDDSASLLLVRLKNDRCRMRPKPKRITVALAPPSEKGPDTVLFDTAGHERLNNSRILVKNPFVTLRPLKRQ